MAPFASPGTRQPDVPSTGSGLLLPAVAAVGVLCLILGTRAVSSGQTSAQVPLIPTTTATCTQRDLDRVNLAFNLRTMLEAYREVGEHNPAWDEPATKFLESVATWIAQPESHQLDDLLAQGAALKDLGCTDPMVLYAHGVVLKQAGLVQDAEVLLRRSLDGLVKRGSAQYRAADAAGILTIIYRKLGGDYDPDARKYFTLHLQYLNESFQDASFAAGEERVPVDAFTNNCYDLYEGWEREVYESLSGNPEADPYLVKYAGGLYHIAAAWEARGVGWAYQVTEEGWEEFERHIEAARELLTEAWHLNPRLPHAAASMITVEAAAGEPGADRQWFRRSVMAQFDYAPAYTSLIWFLRPRWGGSHKEMYDLGLECLRTERFDTRVPLVFAQALREITDDLEDDPRYWRKEGVYDLLEGMFASYGNAQPKRSAWFESVHAAAAYECGKQVQATALLSKLGDSLDETVFQYYAGVDSSAARQKMNAQSVPSESEAAPAGPRNVLHAFDVFSSAEEPFIFADSGTWAMPIGSKTGRIADARQKIIYAFPIPEDAKGAVLYIHITNSFAIGAARDEGGRPGTLREELSTIKWLGHLCFDASNAHDQVLDLTSYLTDNPSRTVYVAIYSAYPQGGWGAAFTRLEVVGLDDDEQQRVDRVRRGIEYFARQDRDRYHMYLIADGGQRESEFIYKHSGSSTNSGYRELKDGGYVIYRLPVSEDLLGHNAVVWVQGDYSVSVAPAINGAPGSFREIAAARDRYPSDVLRDFGNMDKVAEGLDRDLLKSRHCYLKVSDGSPGNSAGVIVRDVSVRKP